MHPSLLINAADFAAAYLFIMGLKRMSSPVTARSGIVLAGWGMLVATITSYLYALSVTEAARPHLLVNLALALAAMLLGVAWAWRKGRTVPMTAMPQMVALYNGMGGGAAACIAAIELASGEAHSSARIAITLAGALIGSVSLSGSLIAWAKLDGRMDKVWHFSGQQLVNGLTMLATVGLAAAIAFQNASGGPVNMALAGGFFGGALLFGVLMTVPIGGADMPVVISLYNAFTGLAVGIEGYVLLKPVLMIAGMVVGAAGTLLTLLMARAMNRSVTNVLFSRFGVATAGRTDIAGTMKPVDAADAGISMRYSSKVIIIPGYGLAVAQAQHKLYEFVKLLQAAGVEVKFAIHPVAGRMPGHMDVLLAEAGVPYDLLFELDDINEDFATTDVALVIGANDVVNPAARTDKTSPIYGMPILNADKAHQVYVIKRGQGKGYSGVENELFFADNTNMVYGDAQAVLVKMIGAVKELAAEAGAA